MKKTIIMNANGESYKLYNGIEEIDGEWLLETSGDPLTKYACEEAEDEATVAMVEEAIEDESRWSDCDASDEEYVREWLDTWGI